MNDIPPAKEKEEEHVTGKFKPRPVREVEAFDPPDVADGNSPFERLFRSGKHGPERFAVDGQFLFYRPVIDRPEDAHVKGCGIGREPCSVQVRLIILHDGRVYCPDWNILLGTEPLETPQCRAVIVGGAGVPQLP